MPDGRPKAIGATTGHRTKAEKELRQAAEEQMNSGKTITPGPVLLEDAAAAAYYDRVIQLLDEVKESIINAYEIKTGLSRAKLSHLMDGETWMNAKKALELGFCDEILYQPETEPAPEEEVIPYDDGLGLPDDMPSDGSESAAESAGEAQSMESVQETETLENGAEETTQAAQ